MAFRVGLLFYSSPAQPLDTTRVAELLEKIDVKSAHARQHRPVTLLAFIRDAAMFAFSDSVAGTRKHRTEAAAIDDAGVRFGPLGAFAGIQHAPYDVHTDFDLGMRVLLWRCTVIVIVCRDAVEAAEARQRLSEYDNTYVCLAVLPIHDGRIAFLEISEEQEQKDEPSWLLAITERWEAHDAEYVPPIRKRTMVGYLFPAFSSALIGRRSETVKKTTPSPAERCRAQVGFSPEASKKLIDVDRKSLDGVRDAVCTYFTAHDDLATHYANVFRTTCLLVPVLIVASTMLAVVAAIDNVRHVTWHTAEGLLLLAAAALYLRSTIAKHHRKWVENRLIAELLRPTLMSVTFHTAPLLTPPTEEPGLWFYPSRLLLQHLRGLPPVAFSTPAVELLSARISALYDYSKYQAQWHNEFASQHRAAAKQLVRMSTYGFVVTLFLCITQLLMSYAVSALAGYLGAAPDRLQTVTEVEHILAQIMMALTLTAAGCAFVVLLLSHQLGFEAIAERSSNAAQHFERLQESIKHGGHAADARQVYAWAHACASAILAEQHSWYRHIPLVRMHL